MEEVYRFTRRQLRWLIFLLITVVIMIGIRPYRNYLYQAYYQFFDKEEEVTEKPKVVNVEKTINSISNIPGWSKEKYDGINIAIVEFIGNDEILTEGTLYDDVLKDMPRPSSIFTDDTIKTGTQVVVTWQAPIEAKQKGYVEIVFDQKTKQVIYKSCSYDL
ncbi:hypothetical protein [Enterococcus sp. 3H8_DIV0648]|uniref:hypothetical protein n=2 Tax=Enterococcus TaxID=1350 RepID=UPI000B62A82D|nr:hypothetical protein [Enterococcus sp. 3H8_DIV0648]OTO14224.1 hypothetical protein A5875_003381 [Enterococcus sp. 3H8_DIV0648]